MDAELEKLIESGKLSSKAAEKLDHLKPGTFCLHKSWGFGRVAEWNLLLNQIVIDFAGKKAHPMQLQYAADNLTAIPAATLPLYHSAMIHGAPNDTARAAMIDSIRSMRVRLTTVYHDPRTGDATRRLERTIRIMNAGLNDRTTCGDAPLGVLPSAVASTVNGAPQVTITWSRSVDEVSGERDVERYALYKRYSASTTFSTSNSFSSSPSGR